MFTLNPDRLLNTEYYVRFIRLPRQFTYVTGNYEVLIQCRSIIIYSPMTIYAYVPVGNVINFYSPWFSSPFNKIIFDSLSTRSPR